jgi:nucleoside-diphosphate-sugar epimerase
VERGAQVIGLDVAEAGRERVEALGAELALADVTERSSVERALSGGIDAVVHAAALVTDWATMEECVRVNVGGTANVLGAARAAGASRAVHLSSVAVYGYDDPSEQSEGAPRRAVGIPYLDTKSASDRLACRDGAVVVRPGDVYGPGSQPWTVRAAARIRSGRACR